jgi:hypothetical protein
MYHNSNAADVDSSSTLSDGAKGPRKRNWEGNFKGQNADNSSKSTSIVSAGVYKGIHLRIRPLTHTDIQCLGREG